MYIVSSLLGLSSILPLYIHSMYMYMYTVLYVHVNTFHATDIFQNKQNFVY